VVVEEGKRKKVLETVFTKFLELEIKLFGTNQNK